MAYSKIGKALADIARKKGQATTAAKKQKAKERFNSEGARAERIAKKKYFKAEKKANTSRPKKEGTKEERAEKAAELRELREQRADNIKELRFKVGGAVKAVKKLLSKKETNPYKSTVGDSYATRSKKQGEIEQFIRNSERSPKKQKEMLKTLSERMKKERKETFDRRGMKAGGAVKKCKRDGIAVRGRTKGRMV